MLTALLLAARGVLAAVFFTAGVAKLRDRAGSREALIGFGMPGFIAVPFGTLLPIAEILVGMALLPVVTAPWAALGALILFTLFVAGIVNAMARGLKLDCHCFGRLHSAPAGWSTLGRTTVLALVAAFVVVGAKGGAVPSYADWLGGLGAPVVAGLFAAGFAVTLLAGGSWVVVHILRQNGRMLLRLDSLERELAERGVIPAGSGIGLEIGSGLEIGRQAPAFTIPDLQGESTALEALLAPGLPVMLIFAHPHCSPCTVMLPEIGGWQRSLAAKVTITLISQGSRADNRVASAEHGIERVLVQQEREVADAYQAYATPSALLVSRDGTVASVVAQGATEIRELLRGIDTVRGRDQDAPQGDALLAVTLDAQ